MKKNFRFFNKKSDDKSTYKEYKKKLEEFEELSMDRLQCEYIDAKIRYERLKFICVSFVSTFFLGSLSMLTNLGIGLGKELVIINTKTIDFEVQVDTLVDVILFYIAYYILTILLCLLIWLLCYKIPSREKNMLILEQAINNKKTLVKSDNVNCLTKSELKEQDKFTMTSKANSFLAKRNIVDSIYSESRLEGIPVTFSQTKEIYEGRTVHGLFVKDIIKINNLKHAWQFILDTTNYPLDLKYVRQINQEVVAGIVHEAGNIRTSSVRITGTKWIPDIPDYEKAESEIKTIMSSDLTCTEKAIKVMLYIMRSQLFFDGNKRTAQLAANQIMIQNGKGLIHIPVDKQPEFLEKLVDYYETADDVEVKAFLYNYSIEGMEIKKNYQPKLEKSEFYKNNDNKAFIPKL